MKTNDLVKYFVQTFVKYMDQPKEERTQLKKLKKEEKEDFMYRWFGLIPFVVANGIRKRKRTFRNTVNHFDKRWKG